MAGIFAENIAHRITYGQEPKSAKVWHIGYGLDDNYVRCTAASIASVCANNVGEPLVFHLLASGLSDANKCTLVALAEKFAVLINIYLIPETAFAELPETLLYSRAMYYRWMLAEMVSGRVLYLDGDIICRGRLAELFACDIKGSAAAAVPDAAWMQRKRKQALGLTDGQYVNSGVLLMDTIRWNELELTTKLLAVICDGRYKFRYVDQDALNIVLAGKLYCLARKWNHFIDIKEQREDSVLLHFASRPKPWSAAWPFCELSDEFTNSIYDSYEQLTSFAGMTLELPHNRREMRLYARSLRKQGHYAEALKWYLRYLQNKFCH